MAAAKTATHQLIDHHLAATTKFANLEALVAARRSVGISWARITSEVAATTGVDVSRASLYDWFPDHHDKP